MSEASPPEDLAAILDRAVQGYVASGWVVVGRSERSAEIASPHGPERITLTAQPNGTVSENRWSAAAPPPPARGSDPVGAPVAAAKRGHGFRNLGIGCGGLVALVIVIIIIAVAASSGSKSGSGGSGQTSSSQSSQASKLGDVIHVGDLDLQIISVTPGFNATSFNQFNDANVAVQLQATNARGKAGATYDFSPALSLKLVDSSGVAHDPASCAGCPNEIGDTGSANLTPGGTVKGTVYYQVPAGATLTQIWYQPLFSTNKAIVNIGQ